LLDIDVLKIIY